MDTVNKKNINLVSILLTAHDAMITKKMINDPHKKKLLIHLSSYIENHIPIKTEQIFRGEKFGETYKSKIHKPR